MKMGVFRWVLVALLAFYPLYLISPAASPVKEKSVDVNEYYVAFGNNDIPFEAFRYAIYGFLNMKKINGHLNDTILTIIDYSLPSTKERLFIIDLKNYKLLKKTLVAHGTETGALYAQFFSNKPQSHQSSLGFFITGDTYFGKHGYSLRMSGIEKGINDNARERAIVFHGAKYVSTTFIEKYGRLGRSFGCPALPQTENQSIIDMIKEESCVFIFYPDNAYLSRSEFLNSTIDKP
jgi:hypothetical protein